MIALEEKPLTEADLERCESDLEARVRLVPWLRIMLAEVRRLREDRREQAIERN